MKRANQKQRVAAAKSPACGEKLLNRVFYGIQKPKTSMMYETCCKRFPLLEIGSKKQHREAIKVFERLVDFMNSPGGSPYAGDVSAYVLVLVTLLDKYEKRVYGGR